MGGRRTIAQAGRPAHPVIIQVAKDEGQYARTRPKETRCTRLTSNGPAVLEHPHLSREDGQWELAHRHAGTLPSRRAGGGPRS